MNSLQKACLKEVTLPNPGSDAVRARKARAFDAAAIGMALLDLDGRWLDVNAEFCRMVGLDRAELLKLSYESLTLEEDLDLSRQYMRRLVRGEIEACDFEKRYRHADGRTIWVQIQATIMQPQHGEAAIVITQARDITAERKTRRALADSEERLSLALEGADLGMWHWSVRDGYFEFNDGACQLLGYDEGEIEPHVEAVRSLIHPDDREEISLALRQHLQHDVAAFDRVIRMKRRDGDYTWVLVRGRATSRNVADQATRISGTLMDVSKWKELEARLRKMATTDELTGLLNRRAGVAVLDRALKSSERSGAPLSMVLMDVDHFKEINDRLGHDAGDQVLQALGSYLRESRRQTDHAIRWGGEEFAIILPGTGQRGARAQAQRLFRGIAGLGGQIDRLGRLSASLGVVTRQPGEPARALLKRADALMYQAKQAGRACIRTD